MLQIERKSEGTTNVVELGYKKYCRVRARVRVQQMLTSEGKSEGTTNVVE